MLKTTVFAAFDRCDSRPKNGLERKLERMCGMGVLPLVLTPDISFNDLPPLSSALKVANFIINQCTGLPDNVTDDASLKYC